jgi:hypothetical protein
VSSPAMSTLRDATDGPRVAPAHALWL